MNVQIPSGRCGWLAGLMILCSTSITLADKPAPPPPDPVKVRARTLATTTPSFKAYVFSDERFPECRVDQGARLEEILGPYTLRTTFLDREHRQVTRAEKAGPYGAIVEITPKKGRPLHRFLTLYRTAAKMADEQHFEPAKREEWSKALGLDAGNVQRQEKLVGEVLKTRPFSEWCHDPRAARLLAGLAQSRGGREPVHKYDDGFALDRQWWVDQKRRLYGWDRAFPKPFTGPQAKEGAPAPVVRKGTLAEAGMKEDTPEKIDAALRAFAADTDQAFAVCIVRHGVIVLHRAYGTRDGKPMTVTTKSWMASVTKTMAASLMLQLVDQGLVGLDDPVDRYLPQLRGIAVKTPLTIRHLYTHTNGLTLDGWPPWDDRLPDVAERLASYYGQLRIGHEWAYTGTGNILGSKIIEAVSGEALPIFFHRHLLAPLGCEHTDVIGSHADAFSVPLDMARFGQMLLNCGSYGKWRFFREETFEQMLPRRLTKLLGPETKKTFGFGLDGSRKKFGHGAASAATFHVDAENDLVVIMTRNKYGKNQDKYNGKFWDAINAGIIKKN